jgi:Fungal specific transcription factor domain.
MRMAMCYGMHTDMPTRYLGESLVQRYRKIWWTVYILDREMTSLMGLPQSIRDDHLHHQAPTFFVSAQRTAALNMQIKLSQVIAEINGSR